MAAAGFPLMLMSARIRVVAVVEDRRGQRGGRQAGDGTALVRAGERLGQAVRRGRPDRLRLGRLRRQQRSRDADSIARPGPTPADRVETAHQVLDQGAGSRHVRTGSGEGEAPTSAREHPRGADEVVGIDTGTLGDVLRREGTDDLPQRVQPRHVLVDERAVVQVLRQDDPHHPGEDGRVFSGPRLEVEGRPLREVTAAGIDHDQIAAGIEPPLQPLPRVTVRNPTQVARERVRAQHHHDLGIVEVVDGTPCAVERLGHVLAGLVDRVRVEHEPGPERAHEPHHERHDQLARDHHGAEVHRHGFGSVAVDDLAQPRRHLVHDHSGRDRLEGSVSHASLRVQQAVGMVVLLGQGTTLDARVALVDLVRRVTRDTHGPTVLDLHENRASVRAEPTVGRLDQPRVRRFGHVVPRMLRRESCTAEQQRPLRWWSL